MAETYCGKTCAQCAEKESLSCPGCKAGPARQPDGDCTLALCCREKGHQDCATCSYNGSCYTLRGKDRMPEYRLKAIEAEWIRAAALAKRAPIFGRWLWALFWLIVPNAVAVFAATIGTKASIPALSIFGQVLNAICTLASGAILIRLSFEEERYRTAGICVLLSSVIGAVQYIPGISGILAWILLLSIASGVISIYGISKEVAAHSAVVVDLDSELAEKWSKFFVRFLQLSAATVGSALLMLIFPSIGALCTIAVSIGLLVIGALKLVYLYRTARLFRKYTQQEICQKIEAN